MQKLGPTFKVEKEVRQGDPLSPKPFVLEDIFVKLNWNKTRQGIAIGDERITHFRFSDDYNYN